MTGFKFDMKKTTPKRHQKLEFQTVKDTTSTPTILPYKNPPSPGYVHREGNQVWFKISLNEYKRSNTYIQAHFREKT